VYKIVKLVVLSSLKGYQTLASYFRKNEFKSKKYRYQAINQIEQSKSKSKRQDYHVK